MALSTARPIEAITGFKTIESLGECIEGISSIYTHNEAAHDPEGFHRAILKICILLENNRPLFREAYKWKMEFCHKTLQNGRCDRLEKCPYAHTLPVFYAMRLIDNPKYKQSLCKLDETKHRVVTCHFVHLGEMKQRKGDSATHGWYRYRKSADPVVNLPAKALPKTLESMPPAPPVVQMHYPSVAEYPAHASIPMNGPHPFSSTPFQMTSSAAYPGSTSIAYSFPTHMNAPLPMPPAPVMYPTIPMQVFPGAFAPWTVNMWRY